MREAWFAIKGEITNQVTVHTERAKILSVDIGAEMKKFRDEQYKIRKQYLSDAFKVNSERQKLEKNIFLMRDRYNKACAEAETANGQVDAARAQNRSTTEVARMVQKAMKLTNDSVKFEEDYRTAVDQLRRYQPVWEEKLTSFYKSLQQQEELRITTTKENFSKFVTALDEGTKFIKDSGTRSAQDPSHLRRMTAAIQKISAIADIKEFVRDRNTGTQRPEIPAFTPHTSSVPPPLTPQLQAPAARPAAAPAAASPSGPSRPLPSGSNPNRPLPGGPRPPPAAMRIEVVALYDYVGEDASQLDFFEGDRLLVVKKDPSGWWTGELDGREGLFPSNYVQEC